MKQFAGLLLGLGLAGAVSTAHALCVNPDGSLDDPSVPPASVTLEVLPHCEASASTDSNKHPVATASGDKQANLAKPWASAGN